MTELSILKQQHPTGSLLRLKGRLSNVTGHVFDHGVIDGEAVVYVHLTGGTNAAFTADRVEPAEEPEPGEYGYEEPDDAFPADDPEVDQLGEVIG